MRCEEAQELITALVDNELSLQERRSIEGHLRDCARCRFIYGEEQALKKQLRMVSANLKVPAALREAVWQRIFAETTRARRWKELFSRSNPLLRPALALAVLILIAIPAVYLLPLREQPISIAAVETYERIVKGALPLIRASSPQEISELLSRSVAGSFTPMGYDLSMMDLKPAGGLVYEVKGRKILVVLYEGKGRSLICYTFLGKEADAPADATIFFDADKRLNFYTFSIGRANAVLHREGKNICILVSEMATEELLALARSKARPALL